MSKINKIAISILTGIIAIFGIHSMSNAYYVGQNVKVTFNKYNNSSNIFCVEHGQSLTKDNYYKIISNVKIEGTKSTDHKGKTIYNNSNAKFAYILSADNGSNHDNGPVQNEIWNYGYTWMKNVGRAHNGLKLSFISSVKGNSTTATTNLDKEATKYANNIGNGKKVTDKTNSDKIKVEAYNKDGKQYMRVGPFNWTFGGELTEITVYDQNSKAISGKLYSTFNGNTENWINIENIKSGNDFYISIPANSGVSQITKIKGKMNVDVKAVNIWFLESTTGYKQNLIITKPYSTTESVDLSFDYNISILGNLKVIKVNRDKQELRLAGVGFYIQNKETGKYIKQDSDRTISYVDKREQSTEFKTDKNGEIIINNLIVGTYVAYETKNPNYGYEIISEGQEKNVVVDKTAELKIPNTPKYIKLSGYVWVDKQPSKQSYTNDLYKTNEHPEIKDYVDDMDILLDGITVRLKDKVTGETVKETTTSNGGKYLFTDVLIEDLDKYYIEFEYDGLTYTNVVPHIDKDNGSKAKENSTVREEFNKDFSVVEGKSENTSITRDSKGDEKYTLTYNLNQNAHTATLNNTGLYPITANTNETGYSIKAHFIPGQTEIKNINLGLYEREQPDIALLKDLENVRVSINGYNHVYKAANRFNNAGTYEQGFNVGVKFGTGKEDEYGNMKYSAAVYKSDVEYTNEQDISKELKVYATYRIRVKNESSKLQVAVNSIADYYDARYTIIKAGTGLDEQENPIGDVSYGDSITCNNAKYKKTIIIIDTNVTKIAKQGFVDVYVQFELSKEAVLNILNGGDNLENIAEINSYSVFDENGNVYAGADKDSNPGNAVPGTSTTYQDDTDVAPALGIELAGSREVSGKVFLDNPTEENPGGTGKLRLGSGAYEDGEKVISGVEVVLKDSNGEIAKIYDQNKDDWKEATANTDSDGNFSINGIVPGDYTLTYKWGDKTYTVQNYKGTIYDSSRKQNDKNWYKENIDTQLTDAIDDYELRKKIDDEIKNITGTTTTTINKMNSITPVMGIGIEEETDGNKRYGITSIETVTDGDEFVPVDFKIKNVDFGIVERPRQDLALQKRVATFKVTLANGQVIADAKISEDGKMTGETNHVTYMGPLLGVMTDNGLVKLELDSELIQGATVEVGYEIKATNNSELDYVSNDGYFYKYGKVGQNDKLVTITPSAIIDYLDKDWAFDANKNLDENSNPIWQVKTLDDIKDIVAETVYNNESSTINEKTILYTESLKAQKLEPTKSATVMLNVSKVLANSDEIELDNETEVLKVEKTGGAKLDSIPGNYNHTESDYSKSETVVVTPNTGDNLSFIVPVVIGVIALAILAAGVVIIKKKTL